MINEERAKRGLHPLDLVFVNMILAEEDKDDHEQKFSNKTSSTYIREYIAKREEEERQSTGGSTKDENQ